MAAADAAVDVATQEFRLIAGGKTFDKLSMDPRHSRYFAVVVDSPTVDVELADDPPNPTPPPDNMPAVAGPTHLAHGANDQPGNVSANDFKDGIDALVDIDEVNMLCVPDRTDLDVQSHMVTHCESLQDRFAILDPLPNATSAAIEAQRSALGSDGGYAALYYPRIVISDPLAAGRITIAPSGHVAGLYARVDDARGVYKAPANEPLREVLDLERTVGDVQQGAAQRAGDQRHPPLPRPGRPRVGRAHDLREHAVALRQRAPAAALHRGVAAGGHAVRRLRAQRALAVGAGQAPGQRVPDAPVAAGALFGVTAADAFSVRIDDELNPPRLDGPRDPRHRGAAAPAPPAEFVVVRIARRPGGPEIQE